MSKTPVSIFGVVIALFNRILISSHFREVLTDDNFGHGFNMQMSRKKKNRGSLPKTNQLFGKIKLLIGQARQGIAISFNRSLTQLHWSIGKLVHQFILKGDRAAYGKEIVATLSQQLAHEFGAGYNYPALTRMIKFYQAFPNYRILATLSQELSWSHFVEIITLKTVEERMFYTQLAIAERWSVRQLRDRVDSLLFQRTALSKKPARLIKDELRKMKGGPIDNPDLVFKDPYLLDFLGLKDIYSEKDLEDAILAQLQQFIIELGNDFAFMARQKRIVIDNVDYKIDLLFYHRGLKCLVAIDLKLGKFRAADKGQMELYLRWLERYEQKEGENAPVGLILCSDKSDEHAELMLLRENRIKVAQYCTRLPSLQVWKSKLRKAVVIAGQKGKYKRALPSSRRIRR